MKKVVNEEERMTEEFWSGEIIRNIK